MLFGNSLRSKNEDWPRQVSDFKDTLARRIEAWDHKAHAARRAMMAERAELVTVDVEHCIGLKWLAQGHSKGCRHRHDVGRVKQPCSWLWRRWWCRAWGRCWLGGRRRAFLDGRQLARHKNKTSQKLDDATHGVPFLKLPNNLKSLRIVLSESRHKALKICHGADA